VKGPYIDIVDQDLLEGLANHEPKTLRQLYREFFPMICHMVTTNQGNEEDAKDLFQDGLMVVYAKAKDPEFRLQCKLKTYIYAVCHRLWLKHLHQRHQPFLIGGANQDEVPATLEEDLKDHWKREEEFRMMDKALDKLGEPCKGLLTAFYLKKHSMQEIAAQFGYTSPDNAKTQKYKCLNRLRKIFFTQYKSSESL
jgi:RNA polymerase sigma factor (sigma-70 family)